MISSDAKTFFQPRWLYTRFLPAVVLLIALAAACGGVRNHPSATGDIVMPSFAPPPDAKIVRDEQNDTILFLKGRHLNSFMESGEHFRELRNRNQPAELAMAFIDACRDVFRLADPPNELAVSSLDTDDLGLTHVRFRQVYREIPVSASEIIVHLNRDNHVYLVNGRYIPTPDHVDVRPAVTPSDALAIAAEDAGRDPARCAGCVTDLIVFTDVGVDPRLAYQVIVPVRVHESRTYFIDARDGRILERRTSIRTGP